MRRSFAAVSLRAAFIAITIVSLAAAPASAQQSVAIGVGDTVLNMSGYTSPDAYVTVSTAAGVIGTLSADSTGYFTRSFGAQQPGITQLYIFARDTDGLRTDSVRVDLNLVEHFPTALQVFLPPSLSLGASSVQKGDLLSMKGRTAPLATVTLVLDGNTAKTEIADLDGRWTNTIDTATLAAGEHRIIATAADGSGNQSYSTTAYRFSVNNFSLPPESPLSPAQATAISKTLVVPTITFPVRGDTVTKNPVYITGKGTPGAQVEVWNNNFIVGTVWADNRGNWSLPLYPAVGQQTVKARSCSQQVCTAFSPEIGFIYQPPQSTSSHFLLRLVPGAPLIKQNNTVTLRLQIHEADPPHSITVDWDDGQIGRLKAQKNEIVLVHTYKKAGKYNGSIIVKNSTNTQEIRFAAHVTGNTSVSPALLWPLIVLLTLWSALLGIFIRRNTLHRTPVKNKLS